MGGVVVRWVGLVVLTMGVRSLFGVASLIILPVGSLGVHFSSHWFFVFVWLVVWLAVWLVVWLIVSLFVLVVVNLVLSSPTYIISIVVVGIVIVISCISKQV